MKITRLFFPKTISASFAKVAASAIFALLGIVAFSSCNKSTAPPQAEAPQAAAQPTPDNEQEIERRVQQRLTEEHLAEGQKQIDERQQQLDERQREIEQREREAREQQQNAASGEAVRANAEVADSYQIFYDRLAQFGSWIEVDRYGYVWQPLAAVSDPSWRPYLHGHWAYTDEGWTWISNEPFGWATYHYGRWARLRRLGWVWMPGDQWAPAWVSWRYSDQFIGWAPLPPEARFDGADGIRNWADQRFDISTVDYIFVPAGAFGEERVATVALPPEQNVTVINQTTNVTNIVESNTAIINNGPNFRAVQALVRTPIQQLRIERRPLSQAAANSMPVVTGQTVQFAAPVFRKSAPAASAAKPAQVKERVADTKAPANPPPSTQPIAPSAPAAQTQKASAPTPHATAAPAQAHAASAVTPFSHSQNSPHAMTAKVTPPAAPMQAIAPFAQPHVQPHLSPIQSGARTRQMQTPPPAQQLPQLPGAAVPALPNVNAQAVATPSVSGAPGVPHPHARPSVSPSPTAVAPTR